jgi:ABC-type multidrug transport system fused ATPase/permease subunit
VTAGLAPSTQGTRKESLLDIWELFDTRARRQLVALLVLNLGAAMLEAASAALIVPFIAMVSNPDYIFTQPALNRIYTALSMAGPAQFQLLTAAMLLFFFVMKNAYLAATISFQYSFIYREMSRMAEAMFARYLSKSYDYHIQTNSSVLIRNVGNEVHMFFTNVVVPLLTVFAEVAVIVAMTGLLLWLSPAPALIAILVLGGVTAGFHLVVRRKVARYGILQQSVQAQRIQSIGQGLGGIKEIKVLGREAYFVAEFAKHETAFSEVTRYAMVLNQMPRMFMETVAFSALFLAVGGVLLSGGTTGVLLPTVALFAVAAMRLMPSANRIQNAITRISYYRPSVRVVCMDVSREQEEDAGVPETPDIRFTREITLRDVGYTYPGASRPSLQGIDLTIPKGVSVALVGPSGAGKTTLADIILGLLQPSSGQILVDGADVSRSLASWQRHLGYIPQTIFLSDDSIRRNVAFGIADNEIDDDRVWTALELAQLRAHVESLPPGLDTVVGERGVSLSGGQRQRVGIARALYNDPDVLILDEATSALDPETEREISQSVDALAGSKTLIIIAHRAATIEKCSLRFHLDKGVLV